VEIFNCGDAAVLRLCIAGPVVVALVLGGATSLGEELAPEVTTPLQEFKVKRLAIEKKAEADSKRELQLLIKKLEKVSKGSNKSPQAGEQAAQLLEKMKSPTFLAMSLDALMEDTQLGVSMRAAEMIDLAYRQRRVKPADWDLLPGDAIEVTIKARKDTGIDVKPGDVILVCPHPAQTWRKAPERDWTTFDGQFPDKQGVDGRQELIARVISQDNPEVLDLKRGMLLRCRTEGRLFLESFTMNEAAEGAIACKVYKMKTR
jgi:hypothetical protein